MFLRFAVIDNAFNIGYIVSPTLAAFLTFYFLVFSTSDYIPVVVSSATREIKRRQLDLCLFFLFGNVSADWQSPLPKRGAQTGPA